MASRRTGGQSIRPIGKMALALLSRPFSGKASLSSMQDHSLHDYEKLVDKLLRKMPEDEAMAQAIGCPSLEEFHTSGDCQLAVLRHHGLTDGMAIYDVGCGAGRTASALHRSGWQGQYKGHDIVARLVEYLCRTCPGYEASAHRHNSLLAADDSLDMVFHWSVFTHLFIEECHNYMVDMYRALKPGGKLVFSFLEIEHRHHFDQIFIPRLELFRTKTPFQHLDTFLHRGQIRTMASHIGFTDIAYTDGMDRTHHPEFWQSLVVMTKPQA